MRRIIKPSKQEVERCLVSQGSLCYQYVNWWLYQKGSDDIIWSVDESSDLLRFCWANNNSILKEIATMLGIQQPEIKYNWLLDKHKEEMQNEIHTTKDTHQDY